MMGWKGKGTSCEVMWGWQVWRKISGVAGGEIVGRGGLRSVCSADSTFGSGVRSAMRCGGVNEASPCLLLTSARDSGLNAH
jgi:hypothetical protein